jgi:hypothetical protein
LNYWAYIFPFSIEFVSESPPCDIPTKLLFVVDSSDAFSVYEFEKIKEFLKRIAISLNIGVSTQVSIISYGKNVSIDLKFDQSNNAYEFYENLDNVLTYQGGKATLTQAMNLVPKVFSSDEKESSILKFQKFGVFFILGKQYEAIDAETLAKSIQRLKAQQVKVLAIGIGRPYASDMFRDVFDHRDDVIIADSFERLSSKVNPLTKRLCTATTAGKINI